eukprot:7034909-Prymnesium_polylepis.2
MSGTEWHCVAGVAGVAGVALSGTGWHWVALSGRRERVRGGSGVRTRRWGGLRDGERLRPVSAHLLDDDEPLLEPDRFVGAERPRDHRLDEAVARHDRGRRLFLLSALALGLGVRRPLEPECAEGRRKQPIERLLGEEVEQRRRGRRLLGLILLVKRLALRQLDAPAAREEHDRAVLAPRRLHLRPRPLRACIGEVGSIGGAVGERGGGKMPGRVWDATGRSHDRERGWELSLIHI